MTPYKVRFFSSEITGRAYPWQALHDSELTGHFTNGHRPPYWAENQTGKHKNQCKSVGTELLDRHICLSRSELMSDTLT